LEASLLIVLALVSMMEHISMRPVRYPDCRQRKGPDRQVRNGCNGVPND
jgi:hypothetical protein